MKRKNARIYTKVYKREMNRSPQGGQIKTGLHFAHSSTSRAPTTKTRVDGRILSIRRVLAITIPYIPPLERAHETPRPGASTTYHTT